MVFLANQASGMPRYATVLQADQSLYFLKGFAWNHEIETPAKNWLTIVSGKSDKNCGFLGAWDYLQSW